MCKTQYARHIFIIKTTEEIKKQSWDKTTGYTGVNYVSVVTTFLILYKYF